MRVRLSPTEFWRVMEASDTEEWQRLVHSITSEEVQEMRKLLASIWRKSAPSLIMGNHGRTLRR